MLTFSSASFPFILFLYFLSSLCSSHYLIRAVCLSVCQPVCLSVSISPGYGFILVFLRHLFLLFSYYFLFLSYVPVLFFLIYPLFIYFYFVYISFTSPSVALSSFLFPVSFLLFPFTVSQSLSYWLFFHHFLLFLLNLTVILSLSLLTPVSSSYRSPTCLRTSSLYHFFILVSFLLLIITFTYRLTTFYNICFSILTSFWHCLFLLQFLCLTCLSITS